MEALTPDTATPRRLLSVEIKPAPPKPTTQTPFPLHKVEAQRAWRKRNSEKIRTHLRMWKYSRLTYQAKREIHRGAACHYRGGSLPDYGYALDRKDNTRGYTRENVVPCCEICNLVKGDRLSYLEMLELGKAVTHIRLRRLQAGRELPPEL